MVDVVRVRAAAVATLASERAWRSKLYAGLSIGGGVLLAGWTILAAMSELKYEHGQDRDDAIAGMALFLVVASALIVFGVSRIARARYLLRAALRAQTQPDVDWVVVGREVRSTDPRGTGGPPIAIPVTGRARDQLVRGQG